MKEIFNQHNDSEGKLITALVAFLAVPTSIQADKPILTAIAVAIFILAGLSILLENK